MTLPVFFRPEQVALNSSSYSPSAAKPQQVVNDWTRHGLDIEVHSFQPVTRHDFYLAHRKTYVDGVLNLDIHNGFDNLDPQVAASLPYTTGSLLAAAEHAVLHRTHTCSPTSGFHHAGHAFGGGFCTFNGLMVTALKLRNDGLVRTVGILDCDAHHGNGTQNIIDTLGLDWVQHHTAGAHFVDPSDVPTGGHYIAWLSRALDQLRDCDLILYQAGADPHHDDPLGGLLDEMTMQRRDLLVHEVLHDKPVAWNLAGGYQRKPDGSIPVVLRLHRNTAQAFGA